MEITRREEILSTIISRKSTLNDYILRVQFELKYGNLNNLAGALLDYFIASNDEQHTDRLQLLKDSSGVLDNDWLLFFYDHMDQQVLPSTPIPESCKSILTEDVQGVFNFMGNPYLELKHE